jgi:hypothetical protein
MGKVTRAAIARAYEVDRGRWWGRKRRAGRRRGGGKGGGGGGWLSGLSAAAPEVLSDVESGSADRGSQVAARSTRQQRQALEKAALAARL